MSDANLWKILHRVLVIEWNFELKGVLKKAIYCFQRASSGSWVRFYCKGDFGKKVFGDFKFAHRLIGAWIFWEFSFYICGWFLKVLEIFCSVKSWWDFKKTRKILTWIHSEYLILYKERFLARVSSEFSLRFEWISAKMFDHEIVVSFFCDMRWISFEIWGEFPSRFEVNFYSGSRWIPSKLSGEFLFRLNANILKNFHHEVNSDSK